MSSRGSQSEAHSEMSRSLNTVQSDESVVPELGIELSKEGAFNPEATVCVNVTLAVLTVVFVALLTYLIIAINVISGAEETEANKGRKRDELNPAWGVDGAILLVLLLIVVLHQRIVNSIATAMGTNRCCERKVQRAPGYEMEQANDDGDIEVGEPRQRHLAEGKDELVGSREELVALEDESEEQLTETKHRVGHINKRHLSLISRGLAQEGKQRVRVPVRLPAILTPRAAEAKVRRRQPEGKRAGRVNLLRRFSSTNIGGITAPNDRTRLPHRRDGINRLSFHAENSQNQQLREVGGLAQDADNPDHGGVYVAF